MIAVVQRVSEASVAVDNQIVGSIGSGLAVLVAVHAGDSDRDIQWMARKLLEIRIFPRDDLSYDLNVSQAGGAILLISNFTVAAETRSGRRPALSPAADPASGKLAFDHLVTLVQQSGATVETGAFGQTMRVTIVNQGPSTFILDSRQSKKGT